jgi:hypothetical protein
MAIRSLETGRTSAIVVKATEYKGKRALDIRKEYNGKPTKKGAFLEIASGQAQFVVEALPKVLASTDGEQSLPGDSFDTVVKRYEYRGMPGISIRKESSGWGKGIWLKDAQANWVAQVLSEDWVNDELSKA